MLFVSAASLRQGLTAMVLLGWVEQRGLIRVTLRSGEETAEGPLAAS